MNTGYISDTTFEGLKTSDTLLQIGDYEGCSFVNCDLSNSDLSGIKFIDTVFIECNFSNSRIGFTSFQDVKFIQCKMLGLRFDECNDFGFAGSFENCQLDHSSFYKMKVVRSSFMGCSLRDVDFQETQLKGLSFLNCDMLNARFENTNLEKANLRDSFNYSIDPEENRVKGAIFSKDAVLGLLDKYQIVID